MKSNPVDYEDLKDENRRLNDLVDMHEETQTRMLSDLARYEDERKKLRKIAEAASKALYNSEHHDTHDELNEALIQWRGGEDD